MMRHWQLSLVRIATFLAPVGLIALLGHALPAYAQLESTSVALVPANADIYIGGYKILEPWRKFSESRAIRGLRDSSLLTELEDAWTQAWRERRGSMARVRSVFENRNTQDALRFVEDVAARDLFFAADESLSDFLERLAKVLKKSHLLSDPSVSSAQKAEMVYTWIDQLGPGWNLPNLILAGAITDKERALSKVDEMEGLLRLGLGMRPEARQALKLLVRIEDPRGSRLQGRIPLASIPWESVPTNEIFDIESRDRLREVVADKSLVFTFGILDNHFVVAIGSQLDPMPASAGDASLLSHPHLQLVRDHRHESITGIRYVSDRLARAAFELGWKDFFGKLAANLIRPMTYEMDDTEFREWLMTCIDDAARIDSTIEAHVPEPRGSTEISVLVDKGWEVHAHNRTANRLFDGTGPLDGARHWGTRPLLMLDIKLAEHPEYFASARAIVRRIQERIEDLKGVPRDEVPDARWIDAAEMADGVWPLMFQWAELWQHRVLPLMNGEHLFVMHAGGLASSQWHPSMPRSIEPLPIPEAALISGIRDPGGWVQTLRAARDWLRAACDALTPASFSRSPTAQYLLSPAQVEHEGGIVFGYPIPANCPAPKSMMPRVHIDSHWSILTYSDSQLADLETASAPAFGHGQFELPLTAAKAAWIDLGGLATVATPWIGWGLDQNAGTLRQLQSLSIFGTEFSIDVTKEDIVNAWRSLEGLGQMSSVTTIREDGSSYSRSVFSFGD